MERNPCAGKTFGSNGTLIDEATARKMVDAGVMAVAISVDGADAVTHDSFRGVDGAFEQTLKGIEACRNVGLPFQLNMVIRKDNLSQLKDMLRLAIDLGANAAEVFDLVAAGRAKKFGTLYLGWLFCWLRLSRFRARESIYCQTMDFLRNNSHLVQTPGDRASTNKDESS